MFIYTITKAEIVFMMRSFLFHTPNKTFYDLFISLVLKVRFYNVRCIFPSIISNSDNY